MKQITHVAVIYNGVTYSLPRPNRHHNVIRMIKGGCYGPTNQGFLTDAGLYINRRDAFVLAKANGQLNRLSGDQYYQGDELFSEDLW